MIKSIVWFSVSQLKEQRMVDLGEESLENLEEVFQRIHTMKGEDNLDVLVTRFIQGEPLQLFKENSSHQSSRLELN